MIATFNLYTISLFLHITRGDRRPRRHLRALGRVPARAEEGPAAPAVHAQAEPRSTKLASPALGLTHHRHRAGGRQRLHQLSDAWISIAFVLVIILGGLQGAYFAKTDRKLAAQVESEIAGGATELSQEYQGKRSVRAAWARCPASSCSSPSS